MKKMITLILTAIAITTMAQEQPNLMDDGKLKNLILTKLCDGHVPPEMVDENGNLIIETRPTAGSLAKEHNISAERMVRMLEEIIRERFPIIEKGESNDTTRMARYETRTCVTMLGEFPNTRTLELLKEFAKSKEISVCGGAIKTYVSIVREDSIPYLREVFSEGRVPIGWAIYNLFNDIIFKLKEENKTTEVEKILTFLQERMEVESDYFHIRKLDEILCANVKGYDKSVQRQNALDRAKVEEAKVENERQKFNEQAKEFVNNLRKQEVGAKISNESPPSPIITDETEHPCQETPSKQPEKTSSIKIILWCTVITLLAVIGSVVAWRKKS